MAHEAVICPSSLLQAHHLVPAPECTCTSATYHYLLLPSSCSFLTMGLCTCCFLCLKVSSSCCSSVNYCLPSRLKCYLFPEASQAPCSAGSLGPLSSCPAPHRASSCGSRERLTQNLQPCPRSLPVPGTWDPGNLCPNDPGLLLGLYKA